jgi:D-methionine transport system substrate-binding protein
MLRLAQFILLSLFTYSAYALKVGVTAGPHVVIMEEVKRQAVISGLDIEIIEFNDFILPNSALESGNIDANSYQHKPFLDKQVEDRGYKIISVAPTILLPIGLYSAKHKDLSTIQNAAVIAIPNDPTNGSRALFLLQTAHLIKLGSGNHPTILDIIDNPRKLKIVEIEAPQIPRSLPDVDYGIVNTDWILQAGMDPKTALIVEDPKGNPYTNVIAVRTENKDNKDIAKLISTYHSPEIKRFIEATFKGAVIPAW